MHCINVGAGSSLACWNVFWHVAVLTSSFSPVLSGGEILANFLIYIAHDEKDSNCVQTADFISFYCFDLTCILQVILVDTLISTLHGPRGDLLCANAKENTHKS